jgi:membrane protein implicated in regulation of membrane protease activity
MSADYFVYIVCLVAGLAFTLLSVFVGHFIGHHDIGSGGHPEAGADNSDGPGVSAISPTIISAFVAGFGAFGVIFHEIPWTRPAYFSAPLSMICAFAVAGVMLWTLRGLFRHTQSSSESHIEKLVGVNATVISPIPQHGVGEIAYVQGGSRYTAPARTESGGAVGNGATVKIHRITGSQFYVVPM